MLSPTSPPERGDAHLSWTAWEPCAHPSTAYEYPTRTHKNGSVTGVTLPFCLWDFNKLHLAVPPAMQDVQIACTISKDQQIPVAKLSILHSFFNRHRLYRDRFSAGQDMRLYQRRTCRKRMHCNRRLHLRPGQLPILM